jgi:exonuclease III
MATFLQLALWNANSLTLHTEELKTFISSRNNDVTLISETHFNEKKLSKTSQLSSMAKKSKTNRVLIITAETVSCYSVRYHSQNSSFHFTSFEVLAFSQSTKNNANKRTHNVER